MPKIKITVNGIVQGVGFRYMTKYVAKRLHVYGTVKNESNGSVTIIAVAADEVMPDFIELMKQSPTPAGRVTSFDLMYDDTLPDFQTFEVIH